MKKKNKKNNTLSLFSMYSMFLQLSVCQAPEVCRWRHHHCTQLWWGWARLQVEKWPSGDLEQATKLGHLGTIKSPRTSSESWTPTNPYRECTSCGRWDGALLHQHCWVHPRLVHYHPSWDEQQRLCAHSSYAGMRLQTKTSCHGWPYGMQYIHTC